MYKVVVNVSGKIARLVPESHKLLITERLFGELSEEDALANRDSLVDAIKGLLADRDQDPEMYTIQLPDILTSRDAERSTAQDYEEQKDEKGPVTKPINPKEGETGDKPEPKLKDKASGAQPTETEVKEPFTPETEAKD